LLEFSVLCFVLAIDKIFNVSLIFETLSWGRGNVCRDSRARNIYTAPRWTFRRKTLVPFK